MPQDLTKNNFVVKIVSTFISVVELAPILS